MYKAIILNNSEFGGIYSNEFLESNQENEINGDLVSNWITTEILPNNLLKPIWSSYEWIEGLTVEEINIKDAESYMLKLQNLVSNLCDIAEAKAIGKNGSKEYIASQRKFYENKYDYAKGNFIDQDTEARLVIETEKFNASYGINIAIEDFKQLIIYRYDDSKLMYQKYMMMIETGRTATQTLIENKEWQKADEAFLLIEKLENENQATETINSILNL